MKKNDLLLLGGILTSAILLYMGMFFFQKKDAGTVLITIDGEKQGEYALDEDLELDLQTTDGYNHLSIKDGEATVTEADCPDKLCVYQKSIRYQGEMIVCLPHRLVIQITEGREAPLDGVAQ